MIPDLSSLDMPRRVRGSPRPRDLLILNALSRAREAADSENGIKAYVTRRAGLFSDEAAQGDALKFLSEVLQGDGLVPEETEFFHQVKDAFPG